MNTTTTLDMTEARSQLAQMPERLRTDHVIWITKHGKKALAMVDPETMQTLIDTLEILKDPNAFRMLQESLEDIRMGRLHDHDDVKRELLQ